MPKSNLAVSWVISILVSIISIGMIGYKWFHVQQSQEVEINVVKNQPELEQLFKAKDTIQFRSNRAAYRIPTGFF